MNSSSIWNKKIPTFAGLIMLVVTVTITSFLVRTGVLFPIRASNSDTPQKIHISNITDNSFVVSYTTPDATTGSVTYGETETFGTVATDIRDTAVPQNYTVHYIAVKNLKPQTTYKFAIISGKTSVQDNDKPFTVTTAQAINPSSEQRKISGAVMLPDGTPPKEAIIYLENDSMQAIATLVKPDGTYTLDIGQLRTKRLDSAAKVTNDTKFMLTALDNKQQATAIITVAQSDQVPSMTLSQVYDFSVTENTPDTTASSSAETTDTAFPAFNSNKSVDTDPQILTPRKDQALNDQQPEFSGTALPNRTVEILIESELPIKTTVRTASDGTWTFRPKQPLAPGKHTITITTRDEAGILRTIVQSFIVNAQGSQFTEPSVSPAQSPSPSLTQTPTATPTAVPTVVVTLIPTLSMSPTATPTAMPTFTPSPTVFVSLQPTIPLNPPPNTPTGSSDMLLFGGLASIAIIAGAMLFFVL